MENLAYIHMGFVVIYVVGFLSGFLAKHEWSKKDKLINPRGGPIK